MPPQEREPFHGPKRKLVLAFELGTTFSGVSYAVLDPGKPPGIKSVTRSAEIALKFLIRCTDCKDKRDPDGRVRRRA
jgi:hypothetical protein